MISSGTLIFHIEILSPTTTIDAAGQQTTEWAVLAKTRANIIQQKGSRSVSAGEIWNSGQIIIVMRYRPGVNFRQRIRRLDTGEVFAITNVATDRKEGSITINATSIDQIDE